MAGNMKITKKMIEACRKKGACQAGLRWISAKPRTIEQLYTYNKDWFLWIQFILTKQSYNAYIAATKPAWDAYITATKPAWDTYIAATKPSWDAYCAAVKPALDASAAVAKRALIEALKMDGWK